LDATKVLADIVHEYGERRVTDSPYRKLIISVLQGNVPL
jgi:hypothetical protein